MNIGKWMMRIRVISFFLNNFTYVSDDFHKITIFTIRTIEHSQHKYALANAMKEKPVLEIEYLKLYSENHFKIFSTEPV